MRLRRYLASFRERTAERDRTLELDRGVRRIRTAEEEIRAERDRLELVLRSVPNPIIVVDNDDQIITMNAAAQRLFGRQGKIQHALANDAKFTSFLAELRLDPAPERRSELVLVDPTTGERLEMEITATEVRDHHGAVVAIVSAMQEVGRLRELERRRLQQVLFETEKLAATGRLAASIAHEINNPLEAVQNSLYLLANVASDATERRYLEIAQRETQRMSRILRQMLGFYRPTRDMAPVDINMIIEEVEALIAKRLREGKVTVARVLDPDLVHILASGDQMKQVLLNLFLNAVEAMPHGGTLTVTTRHVSESEREVPFDAVRIEVADTGLGMDEETQQRIFEAFYSTKTERGTGLGLWVSHGIVLGHGGTMKVRSKAGQGTTFIISLPVAGPPSDA
ncbi:MAG TPA: ATP-binding protein [Candidatus Limnocylindria bacterium]|nr:ATP-binding protein [Candidatus Limnocylindria bacterium]